MSEFIAIVGGIGKGKTSLMTAFLYLSATDFSRKQMQKHEVNELKIDLPLPEVPTAQNYPVTFQIGYKKVRSPQFDAEKIGVPALDENAICFAPYTTIGICEAQTYFNSHKWQQFSYSKSAFFEWLRHWGLTIYLDCQIPCLLNQNIRELLTKVIVVEKKITYDIHNKIVPDGFYVRGADFGSIQWNYTEYESLTDYYNKQNGSKKRLKLDVNVYEMYDEKERRTQFIPPKNREFLR